MEKLKLEADFMKLLNLFKSGKNGTSFYDEKNPLGFQCMHCHKIQYVSTYRYIETDVFYEYYVTCPSCKKEQVLRQKSVMATIREYKN